MPENPAGPLGGKSGFAEIDPLKRVGDAIAKLKFGGILLTVHEGRLVQMEVTEKHRFI